MTGDLRRAVGIDLGGTYIKAALVDGSGNIEHQERCPTGVEGGVDGVATRVAGLVHALASARGIDLTDVAGVGIGVPGVTTSEGTVVLAPNLNWRQVPFKRVLAERLGTRVELDNDANVAALGEARIGAGGGCDSLVLLTLGTGIGGGIILGGRALHGSSFAAGEVGHICVLPDGPRCACGLRGCLEALASGPAMVRLVQDRLSAGTPSVLVDGDGLTPEAICSAAASGDGLGQAAVDHVAEYLGIAIANIIALLSPEVIALGGGISAAGDVLLKPILSAAESRSLEGMFEHTRILAATLGNNAGSIGAALLVL